MATGGLTAADLTAAFEAALRTVIPAVVAPATEPAEAPTAPTATTRFKAVGRPVADQAPRTLSIPNWKRTTLKPVDLDKLRITATKGLPNKFTLMSFSGTFVDGVELLKENIVATTLIARVQEHCQAYCMDEVFQIVTPPADGGNLINDDDTVDLFSHYSSLTRDQVLASMTFYRTFGQDYDLQNLKWSEIFW